MAFDFPNSPTPGQIHTPPGGPSYVWNSQAWDLQTATYVVGGGEGIEEAPNDGSVYGRQSLGWTEIDTTPGTGGIEEAPNTGQSYARKSLGWSVLDITPDWSELLNKPTTFPPSVHTHSWAEITDKPSVQSSNDPSLFINGRLIASVAGGDLSIALVTWAGQNPSVADPVLIAFRYPDGTSVLRTLTTAMSVVVPGAEGAVANVPFRLWIQMLDNAGALSLFVTNASTPNTLTVVNDHIHPAIISRVLGYMDWNIGLVTPGTWNRLPDVIQMFGPGIKLPGDVIQAKSAMNPGALTHSGTTPVSISGLAVTMTPTSPINKFNITAYGSVAVVSGVGGNNLAYVSLRRGGTTIGLETLAAYVNVANVTVGNVCTIIGTDAPGVASALTWDVRIRANVAADVTWFAGGVLAVSEIMG